MVPKNLTVGSLVFAIGRSHDSRIYRATIKETVHGESQNEHYEIHSSPDSWSCPVERLFLTEIEAKAEIINRKKV